MVPVSKSTNPAIGVLSDSPLLRRTACQVINAAGYRKGAVLDLSGVTDAMLLEAGADAWLVALENPAEWEDVILDLYDVIEVPILLGEGQPPQSGTPRFERWQAMLHEKLTAAVGPARLEPPSAADAGSLAAAASAMTADAAGEQVAVEPPLLTDVEPASTLWVLAASLGGPAAVKEFLQALPANLPVAFFIAQHIDPGFRDTLKQVWGGATTYRFTELSAGQTLSAGQCYIAPMDQVVTFDQHARLRTFDQPWDKPYAPCLNQVLQLMAEQWGQQTGAIIFSGMGDDGTLGAKHMRALNIEVWAQTAVTCANSSMPDSARAAGHVTFSGSPAELAAHLSASLDDDTDALAAVRPQQL